LTLNISNSDILQFVWFSNVVLLFFLNLLWMSHAMPKKLVIWWKSHVFILVYIINIILDWLINKCIITWCFSYWPSYRSSVCCIGLGNFSWNIYRAPPKKSQYQSWYLTPCCGLEVQNPIKTLKSVKGPSNTFDLNPKWARTLHSVGNFSWTIYRAPKTNPNIKVDIWHPAVGLRCRIPPRHLIQLKTRAIPLT
jgi:hypothetical protein